MAVLKPMNPTVNYEGAWKELEKDIKSLGGFDLYHTVSIHMKKLKEKHNNMITLKERNAPEIVDYCIKKSVEARMENIHLKKELKEQKRKMVFRNIGYSKFIEKSDNGYSEKANEIIGKIIDKIYKYNTTYNISDDREHRNMSPLDIYIVEMLEELGLTLPHIRKMVGKNVKGIVKVDEKKRKPERKLFKVNLITITKDDLEFTFDWKVTGKKLDYLKIAYKERKDISWHGLKMRIAELNYSYPEGDIKEGMTFRYLRREEDVQRRS